MGARNKRCGGAERVRLALSNGDRDEGAIGGDVKELALVVAPLRLPAAADRDLVPFG